jgi:hypothetical protein
MANELHGIEACVYVDGAKLAVASGYALSISAETCEVLRFEDTWKDVHPGGRGAAGSITAYHDQSAKVLSTLAQARLTYPLLIYPDCSDVTTYYQLEVIFDFDASGDTGSCQVASAPFVVDGAVTKVGFT